MKKTMFVGLTITAFAIAMVSSAVIPVAYAIHNGEGHSDKLSLGECYRSSSGITKDSCQDNKDDWKEAREDSRGPPNGDQDGEPANPHDFD